MEKARSSSRLVLGFLENNESNKNMVTVCIHGLSSAGNTTCKVTVSKTKRLNRNTTNRLHKYIRRMIIFDAATVAEVFIPT